MLGAESALVPSAPLGTVRGYQAERLCVVLAGQYGFDSVAHVEPSSADLDARQEALVAPQLSAFSLGRALGSSCQLDGAINVNEFMDGLITGARQAVAIVCAPDQPVTL